MRDKEEEMALEFMLVFNQNGKEVTHRFTAQTKMEAIGKSRTLMGTGPGEKPNPDALLFRQLPKWQEEEY